ncbi:MAG: thioredoxin domain-containing protein [Synergistaceae bacterium]|nr:thioredoxin domain-containing protein [Synergistaceae bacterium]
MSKVLDSINEKYAEKMLAEKIDLMGRRELAAEFKVQYVPHLLFINANGEIFEQKVGFIKEDDVFEIFEKAGIKIK